MAGAIGGALTEDFREAVSGADEGIDLARAALLVAKKSYPQLDVGAYLDRIEALAARLRERMEPSGSELDRIDALNRFLFGEEGFRANSEHYYDPRNSFLNEVLERRLGIPITLSIVYIEVGRRVGLALQGVAFPGHFLVKCSVPAGTVVLDPYLGGVSLSLEDLQRRLRELRGGEVSRAIVSGMLVGAAKREIIARMLRNLKAIYLENRADVEALAVMDWILVVEPADRAQLRERGLLLLRLECFRAALTDLEACLALDPAAEDAEETRQHVIELRKRNASLH